MALPSSLDSSLAWSAFKNGRGGPFVYSGNLYGVFFDATNNTIEVWKSTDSGDTYTEVDAADHPAATDAGASYESYAAVFDGTSIHVLYLDANEAVRVQPFNCSTDQWGTATAAGSVVDLSSNVDVHVTGTAALMLARRSDGDYIVLRQGDAVANMGTSYRRVTYSRHEGSSWTNEVDVSELSGSSIHSDLYAIAIDAADRAYLFYQKSSGALFCKTLTSANSLGGETNPETSSIGASLSYPAGHAAWIDDSTDRIVIAYRHPTAPSGVRAAYANVADSPSWSRRDVQNATTAEHANSNIASVAINGLNVHVLWVDDSTQDLWQNSTSNVTTTAFGSDTELLDAVTINGISANYLSGIGSGGVGYFYLDGSTVKYNGPASPNVTGTATVGTASAAGGTHTGTGQASATGTHTVGTAAAAGGSHTATAGATGVATVGTAPAAGGTHTGSAQRNETGTQTVGTASAAGGTHTGTAESAVNETGTATVGTAAAAGGDHTGSAATTGAATVGTASAAGGDHTGSPQRNETGTATVGTASAAGGSHSAAAVINETGTHTVGTAAAAGGTHTIGTSETGTATVGTASAAGGDHAASAATIGTATVGTAPAAGGSHTGSYIANYTGAHTIGTAPAAGGDHSATAGIGETGTATVGTAPAGGGTHTGDYVAHYTGTTTVGTATAAGGTHTGTAGEAAPGTHTVGTAAAAGGDHTGSFIANYTGTAMVGEATTTGGNHTGVAAGADEAIHVTGTATAQGGTHTGTGVRHETGQHSTGTATATGGDHSATAGTTGTAVVGDATAAGGTHAGSVDYFAIAVTGTATAEGQTATASAEAVGDVTVGTATAGGGAAQIIILTGEIPMTVVWHRDQFVVTMTANRLSASASQTGPSANGAQPAVTATIDRDELTAEWSKR